MTSNSKRHSTQYSKRHPARKRTRELYGEREQEKLTAHTRHEAIEEVLDQLALEEHYPETIKICKYVPMKVNTRGLTPLDAVLEKLDEEYGDPWGDSEATESTQGMRDAERTFLRTVAAQYQAYICEMESSEIIDVMEWLDENPITFRESDKPQRCPQCGEYKMPPLFLARDRRPRCADCTRTLRNLGKIRWAYSPLDQHKDRTAPENEKRRIDRWKDQR